MGLAIELSDQQAQALSEAARRLLVSEADLAAAGLNPPRRNLAELLSAMPHVGLDADFDRTADFSTDGANTQSAESGFKRP